MNKKERSVLGSTNCDDPIINYKDTDYLEKFLTPQGQILSRRRTGFCAQCQKELDTNPLCNGQWALSFDVKFQYPLGPVCSWPNEIDCSQVSHYVNNVSHC